jgi:hypothetical protein
MIELLKSGKRIINIDESWVNQTHFHRRQWAPTDSPATATVKEVNPRLSLIAALDTDGRVAFALLHANTEVNTFLMFLSHLFACLDEELPGWKQSSVILLDNATYHVKEPVSKYIQAAGVEMMYSAPYSYCKFRHRLFFDLFV